MCNFSWDGSQSFDLRKNRVLFVVTEQAKIKLSKLVRFVIKDNNLQQKVTNFTKHKKCWL